MYSWTLSITRVLFVFCDIHDNVKSHIVKTTITISSLQMIYSHTPTERSVWAKLGNKCQHDTSKGVNSLLICKYNVVRAKWLNKYKNQYTHHNFNDRKSVCNDVLSPFGIGSALSLSRAQEFEFTTVWPTVFSQAHAYTLFCYKACLANNTYFSLLLDRLAEHNLICSMNIYFLILTSDLQLR